MVRIRKSTANYMRMACLAVGGYDFIVTIPAEWRIYMLRRRFRIASILFFLIRYTSLLTLVIDSYLWFHSGFTSDQCQHLFLLPTIFKALQMMVSHAIMGWRTCNISQRRTPIIWFVSVLYGAACTIEWFTSLYHTKTFIREKNCQVILYDRITLGWLFYFLALIYDFFMVVLSFWFLLRIKSRSRLLLKLRKAMIVDGLGYFILLAATNIINIIVYLTNDADEEDSAVPVGYTLTWIMSQRILIRLNDTLRRQMREDLIAENVAQVLSGQSELSAHVVEEVSREVRSQLRSENNYKYTEQGSGKSADDYNSNHSSQQVDTRRGKRVIRRVVSTVSEPYLDSVIDLEVDIDVSDRPTMIVGQRSQSDRSLDQVDLGERSGPKDSGDIDEAER